MIHNGFRIILLELRPAGQCQNVPGPCIHHQTAVMAVRVLIQNIFQNCLNIMVQSKPDLTGFLWIGDLISQARDNMILCICHRLHLFRGTRIKITFKHFFHSAHGNSVGFSQISNYMTCQGMIVIPQASLLI